MRARLDAVRPVLGAVFLAAYAAEAVAPGFYATAVFLGTGLALFAMSVPFSSSFHKGLAAAATLALGALLVSGRFEAGAFLGGLRTYFGIVAVLLVLSVAGYPIRAGRFADQIRALLAATARKGFGTRATSGALGHVLGSVLDVGALVLIDAVLRRAVANDTRFSALVWSGRAFSFAPLWTNLNILTATTIILTGVSYPALLAVSLPFVVVGLAFTLLVARKGEKGETGSLPETPLNRSAAAVLAYPVLLVAAVAVAQGLFSSLSLTVVVALTVAAVVALVAVAATAALGTRRPLKRLGAEARDALTKSHAEFALFGAAGVLVLSLTQLGALAPLGRLFQALPEGLVAPALFVVIALGFLGGIHVVPMVLLVDAAFPLDAGPAPALWAMAVLLGSQGVLLLSPFSNTVTMLARLSGLHPIKIGARRNVRFALVASAAGLLYLIFLTLLLL